MLGRTVIDNTNIEVTRLGFGTASLHQLFSSRRRLALLQAAEDIGIAHFDTAPYYGYGLAECDLGMFMAGRRSRFTVTTKVGMYPAGPYSNHSTSVWLRKAAGKVVRRIALPVVDWKIERAKSSLLASLKRLKTDYVDFLFLHEPEVAMLNTEEMHSWLEQELDRGRIRGWGVAGVRERIEPIVLQEIPVAAIVQTQDSLDRQQADYILNAGRRLQFTYGYLTGARSSFSPVLPTLVIQQALQRNSTGSVLVSSRSVCRLQELSSVLQ